MPEFTVTLAPLDLGRVWDTQDEWQEQIRGSKAIWGNLDNLDRLAVMYQVQKALLILAEHLHEWLPESLTPSDQSDMLDVSFKVILAPAALVDAVDDIDYPGR